MIDQHVRISSKCFRDMILFSGKHANRLMNPEELKHSYGYILTKSESENIIDVVLFIPIKEGSIKEMFLDKNAFKHNSDFENLELCGFFHGFPRSGGRISERDLKNLSSFGLKSICIMFDFTKVNQYNNGFLVYQLEEGYVKNTPYTITHPENQDKFYFARSLVDLSEKYESTGSLSLDSRKFEKEYNIHPSIITSPTGSDPEYLVEIPQPTFEDYELSLIEQDFEIQKLRNDINQASKEGESSAYLKLQLANRLISHMANESEILRYLESAEEEFQASQDSKSIMGLAITKNELGLFYEERGNYYTALNYFDDAYNLLEDLGDDNRKLRILNNIGNVYYNLNDFDAALQKYDDAYNLADNLVDKVMVYNNIAEVYLKLRNYGRAFSILVKNAEFFQKTQNNYGLSLVFSKLGELYYEQGKEYYHLAKKYTQLALSIKKSNEFYNECIEDYELLSTIYLNEGAYPVAEENLIQGLNIVRTLGFEQKESFFYHNLGDLYLLEKKIDESMEYFELARESYSKFAEKEAEGQICEKMGNILYRFKRNLPKALEYYENSLNLYKEENFRRKQADVLVTIAEIHLDLNEKFTAIEKFQKAHTLYKSMYDESTAKIISERIKSLEI